jgi:ParB family chromosome partitioning protein
MLTTEIKTAPPFQDLFPINNAILKEVVRDMKKNGFDESKPIVLWDRNSTVIDGHTRLMAAQLSLIRDVPVVIKEFRDEERALEYAINSQKNRRSLTDQEILQCIAALDKKKDKRANLRQGNSEAQHCASGKTAEDTAALLGISPRKVEQTRTVMDKASDEIKDAVKAGEMSINAAYNKTVNPEKGSPESLRKAVNEIELMDALISVIKERLTREQVEELISRLQKDF